MTPRRRPGTPRPLNALRLALLVTMVALAGCTSGPNEAADSANDDPGPDGETSTSAYEDARRAPGPVFAPVEGGGPYRLKLLGPHPADNVPLGHHDVRVLLFDQQQDTPVMDAALQLDAMMVEHGHGTSPETDPVHDRDGIYIGRTNLNMEGEWRLGLRATLGSGETLEFHAPVQVTDDGATNSFDVR